MTRLNFAAVVLLCSAVICTPAVAKPAALQAQHANLAHVSGIDREFVLAAGEVLPEVPPAPAPASNMGAKLLDLLTPASVGTGLSLVLGAIGGLSFLTARRKKAVALAAYHAFHIVEDIGNEIEGDDAFDKTATYLKQLDAFMVANGWRPLKPGETEVAKLTAQALHGAEVAKAKVSIAAVEAAAAAGAPSP